MKNKAIVALLSIGLLFMVAGLSIQPVQSQAAGESKFVLYPEDSEYYFVVIINWDNETYLIRRLVVTPVP